jgi:hypothetical protein
MTDVQQKLFEVVDTMVADYVKENEVSPFKEIKENESSEEGTISLSVDMDKDFEDKLQNKLKDKLDEALEVYFTKMLEMMAEQLKEDEKGLTKE